MTSSCGVIKNVFRDPIGNLTELKTRVTQHIHSVIPDTFSSAVVHAAYRFQLVAGNGRQHTELVLRKSNDNQQMFSLFLFIVFWSKEY